MKEVQPPEVSTLVTFVAEAFGRANRSTLEAHFAVGDKIGAYLALSGRPVQPVVKMVAAECGPIVSWTTLRTAVTLANRLHKPSEREAMLSTACTVNAAIALSLMDADERTRTIRDCKSGKRKWQEVMSRGQRADRARQKAATLRRRSVAPEVLEAKETPSNEAETCGRVTEIRHHLANGQLDPEGIYDGLCNLLAQVPFHVAEAEFARAMRFIRGRKAVVVTDRDRARLGRQSSLDMAS